MKTCLRCFNQVSLQASRCPYCTEIIDINTGRPLSYDRPSGQGQNRSSEPSGSGILLAGSFFLACYLGYTLSSNWPLGIWFIVIILAFIRLAMKS